MKNVQIIDGADNATYSVFQAADEEFATIFPEPGQDLEIIEDYVERVGDVIANKTLSALWERPIHKHHVCGIHGTLFYDFKEKAKFLPKSKREMDRPASQRNEFERVLYQRLRQEQENDCAQEN
jgi:hypothetical protein